MQRVVPVAILNAQHELELELLMYRAKSIRGVLTRESLVATLTKNSCGLTSDVWTEALEVAISRDFVRVGRTGESEYLWLTSTEAATQHATDFSPYITTSAWFVAAADAEFRKQAHAR
jgi:hypothetical protein